MRDSTRNKFMLCNLCIRPVVDVDRVLDPTDGGGSGHGYVIATKRKKQKPQGSEVFSSENVAGDDNKNNNSLPSRPRHRSLSRVLKAVMFGSALTRRIRRRKAFNSKARTAEQSNFPSPTGTGQDVEGFETDDPQGLSLMSLRSDSKRTDYTTEMYSDSSSDSSSGLTTHGTTTEQEQDPIQGSAHKGHPEKLTTAFSRLNHRAVCVILTVVGVTVAWGKACAILFTSIWLYSMFFQRITARSRIYRGLSRHVRT